MVSLEAGQVGWWLSIDFRGCSLFGDDALGSDLLLLLMRLGLACNAFNICAWGGRWGPLGFCGWFLLNRAIDVPACQGVLNWDLDAIRADRT